MDVYKDCQFLFYNLFMQISIIFVCVQIDSFVGRLFCFTVYQPILGYLTPNRI